MASTANEAVFDLDFHAVMHWGQNPVPGKALRAHPRSQRARSVLTFFAQDTGTHNLVYANADISKATQAREAIAFCDHWKAVSGSDPKMLIMDEKVGLWVPKTYATRRYSWMTPPTRSCRRTRK